MSTQVYISCLYCHSKWAFTSLVVPSSSIQFGIYNLKTPHRASQDVQSHFALSWPCSRIIYPLPAPRNQIKPSNTFCTRVDGEDMELGHSICYIQASKFENWKLRRHVTTRVNARRPGFIRVLCSSVATGACCINVGALTSLCCHPQYSVLARKYSCWPDTNCLLH